MGSGTRKRKRSTRRSSQGGQSAAALDASFDAEFERESRELEESGRTLTRVLLFVFLGIAVLMVVVAVLTGISTSRKLAREQRALGQVTELIERKDENANSFYYPRVAFDVPDGGRYNVPLAEGSWPPSHRVGDLVTVLYDSQNPMDARMDSRGGTSALWTWTLVTGVLGVAFLGAAALAWWIGR